jgi:hypothetical protein
MWCASGSIARAERLAARSAEIDRISSTRSTAAAMAPAMNQRVGEVEDDVADLDHVRPNSRSISLSFSST